MAGRISPAIPVWTHPPSMRGPRIAPVARALARPAGAIRARIYLSSSAVRSPDGAKRTPGQLLSESKPLIWIRFSRRVLHSTQPKQGAKQQQRRLKWPGSVYRPSVPDGIRAGPLPPLSLTAIGASPSGKAVDFDSTMRRFESSRPSQGGGDSSECNSCVSECGFASRLRTPGTTAMDVTLAHHGMRRRSRLSSRRLLPTQNA
jgi:hypothetical protein